MSVGWKTVGLRAFTKGLKQIDAELGKEMRVALNRVADVVVADARPRLPVRSGALAGSLRAASTQSMSRVRLGSARVPYAGWIEFGGVVMAGRKKTSRLSRPYVPQGRVLFPAVERNRARLYETVAEVLEDVAKKAGLI